MNLGRILLFVISAPYGIGVGWLWILVLMAFGFARKPKFETGLVLTAEWRDWFAKKWKFSTTIGRAIVYHPSRRDDDPSVVDSRLERHERKHVWQIEDLMLLSFVISICLFITGVDLEICVALYVSGGVWQVTNFLASGLRYGFTIQKMYRGSEHERSAYAQTDLCIKLGRPWEELDELRDD